MRATTKGAGRCRGEGCLAAWRQLKPMGRRLDVRFKLTKQHQIIMEPSIGCSVSATCRPEEGRCPLSAVPLPLALINSNKILNSMKVLIAGWRSVVCLPFPPSRPLSLSLSLPLPARCAPIVACLPSRRPGCLHPHAQCSQWTRCVHCFV